MKPEKRIDINKEDILSQLKNVKNFSNIIYYKNGNRKKLNKKLDKLIKKIEKEGIREVLDKDVCEEYEGVLFDIHE